MASHHLPLVITGVASGIGAETAAVLRSMDVPLIGVDRTAPSSFPGTFVQADLATEEGVRDAASRVEEAAPDGLGGLANIAGVPGTAPWRTVLSVNVFGLRDLTRALAPVLSEGASVVNLASSVAFQWRSVVDDCARLALAQDREVALEGLAADAHATEEAYLFSKQCVRFLTEHLCAELLPRHIRVNSVSPGPVQTPILEDFKADHGRDKVEGASRLLGRFGQPEDIARVVVDLLTGPATWVNGADIRVDGGLTAVRASGAVSAVR